jgi:thiol-disulfide isomerase/thioredoxin
MLEMRAPVDSLRMAVLLLVAVGCASGRTRLADSSALGQQVELAAPDLRGQEHRVAGSAGPVRVVDLWATWCEPCREQFPVLAALVEAHPGAGLAVYAVSVDEDRAQLEAYLEATPLPFTVLWDKGGSRTAERIGVERLPTTLVVDRAGRVRFVHRGWRPGEAALLGREVSQLLTEPR